MARIKRFFPTLILFSVLAVTPAQAVVTTIVNDLNPSEPGAILIVSNIKGKGLQPNLRVVLNPGETRRLSARNVVKFTLTRIFGDYREKFVVGCPTDPRVKNKITLRLIDIQNNSMPAGCLLERTGRWTPIDGIQWDEKPVTIRRSPQYSVHQTRSDTK